MAAFAHVGFARERINPGWANNGRDDVQTFNVLNTVANNLGPQLLLSAMVFDGVFERHPKLTVVVEEVGVDWLPHLVSRVGRQRSVESRRCSSTTSTARATSCSARRTRCR